MIQTYEKIAIIYGASGRECAIKIDTAIQEMHAKEFYPVKPFILAKEIMSSASILATVKELISASSACVVILTFDDVNNSRIRQNVLVEIGMALMLLDQENCFFISEKKYLPEDFPSDLRDVINPNYFDKSDLDKVAKDLCLEIKDHLHLKTYKNILSDDKYVFDYTKILDDIPAKIFDEKADVQLEHILDQWELNINSFEFTFERILYILERIVFFTNFNCNERFFRFLTNIKESLKPTYKDYAIFETDYLIHITRFTTNLITYTETKLQNGIRNPWTNSNASRSDTEYYKYSFQYILDEFKEFLDVVEHGAYHYNWFIQLLAYNYTALAQMKVTNYNNRNTASARSSIELAIQYYEKVNSIVRKNDLYSHNLWMGYTNFNLARAYADLYKLTGLEEHLEKTREYSAKAVYTRRQCFQKNRFKGVFANALSYEYFLAHKYEYEWRYQISAYASDSAEEILNGLENLKTELYQYCESTELGRLYDIKDSIDHLIRTIKA